MKQTFKYSQARRGFTIVELVVAFIIIAILAGILVPSLLNRAEQARIAAAQADLVHLGDAQERVGIDTGFMLRVYALDDIGGPGDNVAATDIGDVLESILDNRVTANNLYTDPINIFINLATENYSTQNDQRFLKLVSESGYNWKGPYLQWPRDINQNDWPDDPWGNDYLFFTRAGVIFPPQSGIVGGSNGQNQDGSATFNTTYVVIGPDGTTSYPALVFDRPTFLSLGPNGLPGDGSGTSPGSGDFGFGDDLIHQIGAVSGQVSPFTQPRGTAK
jgi:prepilin-type N-terminal cleavage/methylation domain-containing protein